VLRRVSQHKQMESKMLLGQKMLREGCEYLLEKKYTFKSVYE
jgi:hypothetical protein